MLSDSGDGFGSSMLGNDSREHGIVERESMGVDEGEDVHPVPAVVAPGWLPSGMEFQGDQGSDFAMDPTTSGE
jgi:hypothetical protein